MAGLDGPVDRETILALEPTPHAMLDEAACEEAYLAIADFIDMRMPFTFGHSRAVASLADAAAKRMGLPAADIRDVRWAAYTHDIGELTVPVATWMRAGTLTERETDAAHLHPYHGERALASLGRRRQSRRRARAAPSRTARRHRLLPQLARPRPLAGRPHPGRGRSLSDRAGGAAPPAGIERCGRRRQAPRRGQGRKALPRRRRSRARLRRAAGAPRSAERLAGLTPREIEVLRLIAAGDTTKEAARKLEIAPKTADNHIQSLYSKIGVTTRAGAALYALERGLVQHEISWHRESSPCAGGRSPASSEREPGHSGRGTAEENAMKRSIHQSGRDRGPDGSALVRGHRQRQCREDGRRRHQREGRPARAPARAVLEDSATIDSVAEAKATKLVQHDGVDVLFGGIYSSTRQAIKGPPSSRARSSTSTPSSTRGRSATR